MPKTHMDLLQMNKEKEAKEKPLHIAGTVKWKAGRKLHLGLPWK